MSLDKYKNLIVKDDIIYYDGLSYTLAYEAIDMETNGNINYKLENFNYYNQSNPLDNYTNVNIGTNLGILGDKVGYGKTLIALSIIANNPLKNIYI